MVSVPLEAEGDVDYHIKILPHEPLRVFCKIDMIKRQGLMRNTQ